MFKAKRLIPMIVLIVLLISPMFRWEYTASKTTDNAVLKWKTDRWTGQQWFVGYAPNRIVENPVGAVNAATAWWKRERVNETRKSFIAVTVAWFLGTFIWGRKRQNQNIAGDNNDKP
jgi:hypothetical protein